MPIITFWSNKPKAIGQTVAVATTALTMAIEHNYKILLVSADINNSEMENCFGAQESNKEILKGLIKKPQMNIDSGINGLLKLANSNRVTPELIHDYTKIIFKSNRLEVLYSPMNIIDENEKKYVMEKLKNIILNAARYYDQVIIDLSKDMKYSQQQEILEISDVVVQNIDQSIKTIENLLTTDIYQKIKNKLVWNICRADNNSKYNAKNITRNILKKQKICETCYNTLVHEASEDGTLAELMLKFRTLQEESNNLLFYSKTKELVEMILSKYQETRMRI